MNEPLSFPSLTPQFALPLLFSGQAQKEFFINQALATIDCLLQQAIEESRADPPASPSEGQCYRVSAGATGDWSGKDDQIAIRLAGSWRFVTPPDGYRVYDRSTRQFLLFDSEWKIAGEPTAPSGGSVVDTEARAAITELTQALRNAGVFAA